MELQRECDTAPGQSDGRSGAESLSQAFKTSSAANIDVHNLPQEKCSTPQNHPHGYKVHCLVGGNIRKTIKHM